MERQKITIISGAGISAESGISTFRDSNGLWEKHAIEEVASPAGWVNNPALVLQFYNERRKQMHTVEPNAGHTALQRLEEKYDVCIITQNVDDLHERAGSTNILHLHGELRKSRSTGTRQAYLIEGDELNIGDRCPDGFQLRPHIVWFGEEVADIQTAMWRVIASDAVIVVGTSMSVYPANELLNYTSARALVWVIDQRISYLHKTFDDVMTIEEKSGIALPILVDHLLSNGIVRN